MRIPVVVVMLALVGCTRDLQLPNPPDPKPGSITGRLVVEVPGTAARRPAAGAVAQILGTSLVSTTSADGYFSLNGIVATDGVLFIRFDEPGKSRRKQYAFSRIGAGPNRTVALGDVVLGESATVRGRAILADKKNSKSGHGGTQVFVPLAPYFGFTGDDGTFLMQGLPEGDVEVALYRTGYAPISLGTLTLGGGEFYETKDLQLEPDTSPGQPTTIKGKVVVTTESDTPEANIRVAPEPSGTAQLTSSGSDGLFAAEGLTRGVWSVRVEKAGYGSAVLHNVFLPNGGTVDVGSVVLAPGSTSADAGLEVFPTFDAGVQCTTTRDCTNNDWCDDGFCRPLCSTNGDCTDGRRCDSTTRTCVVPCDNGCPSGTTCDVAVNSCRALCDGSLRCRSDQKCSAANLCVPECTSTADCKGHQTCTGGACVPDGTCDVDMHCPKTAFCVGTSCVARTNAPATAFDGGASFACTAGCDCRMDEWCTESHCEPLAPPTRFVSSTGTGDGGTPQTPFGSLSVAVANARPNDVIAVKAGDTFTVFGPMAVNGSDISVGGGYAVCAPNRWVRDSALKSNLNLNFTYSGAFDVSGTAGSPKSNVAIRGFFIQGVCPQRMVSGRFAPSFLVEGVSAKVFSLGFGGCGAGGVNAVVACDNCDDVSISNVGLTATSDGGATTPVLVDLKQSSGVVSAPWTAAGLNANGGGLVGVGAMDLSGPLLIEKANFAAAQGIDRSGIWVQNCGAHDAKILGNVMRWWAGTTYQNSSAMIHVQDCDHAEVSNNNIDGTGQVDAFGAGGDAGMAAFELVNSGGVFDSNTIVYPSSQASMTRDRVLGVAVVGPLANWTISGLNASEGSIRGSHRHAQISDVSQGNLLIKESHLLVTRATESIGFEVRNVLKAAGLRIEDCDITSGAMAASNCDSSTGLWLFRSSAVVERSRIVVPVTGGAEAVVAEEGTQLELYQNLLYAGPSAANAGLCAVTGPSVGISRGLYVGTAGQAYPAADVYAVGNTIEGRGDLSGDPLVPSIGITCNSPTGTFISNLVGGGASVRHWMYNDTDVAGCGNNWKNNYFWFARKGARFASDHVGAIAKGAPGVADQNGNIIGDDVGCYENPDGGANFVIADKSPCVDTGSAGVRKGTMTPVAQDIEKQTRVVGSAADIGAYERQQ